MQIGRAIRSRDARHLAVTNGPLFQSILHRSSGRQGARHTRSWSKRLLAGLVSTISGTSQHPILFSAQRPRTHVGLRNGPSVHRMRNTAVQRRIYSLLLCSPPVSGVAMGGWARTRPVGTRPECGDWRARTPCLEMRGSWRRLLCGLCSSSTQVRGPQGSIY